MKSGYITEHLSKDEVACKGGCGYDDLKLKIAQIFERIRARCSDYAGYDVPLFVNSGCRCKSHNKAVGGVDDSCHPKGEALDTRNPKTKDVPREIFRQICDEEVADEGGVGIYNNFVHIDCRGHRARWHG